MNGKDINHHPKTDKSNLLLAIHSSSDTLGVAMVDLTEPKKTRSIKTFDLGKNLSNKLISCIEELIPSSKWNQITRLSVSIGPGGFTSTRLSVVMARTLAEQIKCDIDGISSFELMAPRLFLDLKPNERNKPFWIIQNLPRRGLVGGEYQIIPNNNQDVNLKVIELKIPQLLKPNTKVYPSVNANVNAYEDVKRLLYICEERRNENRASIWKKVIPIYPTSPVGNQK